MLLGGAGSALSQRCSPSFSSPSPPASNYSSKSAKNEKSKGSIYLLQCILLRLSYLIHSELQASEAVREHWFRFDDEVLDMKNRPSDEIKRDGRPSQSEERKDVNRTVTRISAGRRSLKNFENYWNFGVTVTKQVS